MSQPVVEVTNLGKRYLIKRKNRPDSLRELLSNNPLRNKEPRTHTEELWAIKDINFELREGETLGIIGRNGAGKSTLLKILSRIVAPTTGQAIIRGKTASLLEVGTGFHPELTGRENVYFNGALLGMGKAEIDRKFIKIVEFSEIGNFIDNPVKHYSSGMRGRLAFSVAAHLDADIMIIDEALSAGDVGFRKKAQEKMKAAAFEGRSVLFVTHSMGSAEDLCDRSLYLKNGRQEMIGETKTVIDTYLGVVGEQTRPFWKRTSKTRLADKRITPLSMQLLLDGKPHKKLVVERQSKLEVGITLNIPKPSETMSVGVSVYDEHNRRLFRIAHTDLAKPKRLKLAAGKNSLAVTIPLEVLKAGDYSVALDCDVYKDIWIIHPNNTEARVGFSLRDNLALVPGWDPQREALIKPPADWRKLS